MAVTLLRDGQRVRRGHRGHVQRSKQRGFTGKAVAPVVGRRVDEIPLPDDATIGAIVRGNEVIMAHHDTVIEAEDHVILFLVDRNKISAVEKLFQVGLTFF